MSVNKSSTNNAYIHTEWFKDTHYFIQRKSFWEVVRHVLENNDIFIVIIFQVTILNNNTLFQFYILRNNLLKWSHEIHV